jgi:hypothetical protein
MRLLGLTLLFAFVMVLQGLFLVEAFHTSNGTLVQMAASQPIMFVAEARNYRGSVARS